MPCLCLSIPASLHLSDSPLSDSAVTSDDLLAWLRPFCGDASLPVRPRIDVLQILESNFSLRDSDVRLLLLYRTKAVLKDREVICTDIRHVKCTILEKQLPIRALQHPNIGTWREAGLRGLDSCCLCQGRAIEWWAIKIRNMKENTSKNGY